MSTNPPSSARSVEGILEEIDIHQNGSTTVSLNPVSDASALSPRVSTAGTAEHTSPRVLQQEDSREGEPSYYEHLELIGQGDEHLHEQQQQQPGGTRVAEGDENGLEEVLERGLQGGEEDGRADKEGRREPVDKAEQHDMQGQSSAAAAMMSSSLTRSMTREQQHGGYGGHGGADYSTPGLDALHWAGVKKNPRDLDQRSIASSMAAERDDKSIYEEPAIGAVEEEEESELCSEQISPLPSRHEDDLTNHRQESLKLKTGVLQSRHLGDVSRQSTFPSQDGLSLEETENLSMYPNVSEDVGNDITSDSLSNIGTGTFGKGQRMGDEGNSIQKDSLSNPEYLEQSLSSASVLPMNAEGAPQAASSYDRSSIAASPRSSVMPPSPLSRISADFGSLHRDNSGSFAIASPVSSKGLGGSSIMLSQEIHRENEQESLEVMNQHEFGMPSTHDAEAEHVEGANAEPTVVLIPDREALEEQGGAEDKQFTLDSSSFVPSVDITSSLPESLDGSSFPDESNNTQLQLEPQEAATESGPKQALDCSDKNAVRVEEENLKPGTWECESHENTLERDGAGVTCHPLNDRQETSPAEPAEPAKSSSATLDDTSKNSTIQRNIGDMQQPSVPMEPEQATELGNVDEEPVASTDNDDTSAKINEELQHQLQAVPLENVALNNSAANAASSSVPERETNDRTSETTLAQEATPRVDMGPEWENTFRGVLYEDGMDSLGRPVVVINADAVPSNMRSSALTYVKTHLEPLVTAGHYVIVFTARQTRLPSLWIMGAYQSLPRPYRKNVQYVILVRPSGFLRAVLMFMRPFVSKKAGRKIKLVDRLEDISIETGGEVTMQHLSPAFLEADAAEAEREAILAASAKFAAHSSS